MAKRGICEHQPAKLRWNDAEGPLWRMLGIGPGWVSDYDDWYREVVCEHGRCGLDVCPVCGCVRGGIGPAGCPCDHYPAYPGQRPRPRSFGLKPSIARRRSGKHRAKPRR